MTIPFLEVDVRPTLRAGGEPFGAIMAAVAALEPGQGIRFLATFRPVPLFHVLGQRGFTHEAREIGGGDWEVLFTPDATVPATAPAAAPATVPAAATAGEVPARAMPAPAPPGSAGDWPEAGRHLDLRDLDPPEPMVRILATLESLPPRAVLSALLRREPAFLLPELRKRGHDWRGGFEDAAKTCYRITIRAGGAHG